jgi:hypothetical protein
LATIGLGCHTIESSDDVDPGQWRVRLTWQTETESNAFGFYIHRADSPDGAMRKLNPQSPVHAAGTTTIPQRYRYYDLDVDAGKIYYYKLEQVDLDGASQFIIGADRPIPGEAKPLTADESREIQIRGIMFREEAGG